MIVGIVLSVPATSAPPSEPGGVITASENLLGSVGGDLKTRRSFRPLTHAISQGRPATRSPG